MTRAVLDAPRLDPAIVEAIRDVVRDVIRAELRDALAPRPRSSPDDLLPIVEAVVGARAFTSAELIQHATVDPALHALLGVFHATTPKRLGWMLRALEDRPIKGLRLRRVGEERDGLVWCIFREEPAHKAQTF